MVTVESYGTPVRLPHWIIAKKPARYPPEWPEWDLRFYADIPKQSCCGTLRTPPQRTKPGGTFADQRGRIAIVSTEKAEAQR
jgi:hypothetical protein